MGLRFHYLPDAEYAAMASTQALGNGQFKDVRDVVYVSPDRFDKSATHDVAASISKLNAQLGAEGRK